MGRFSRIQAKRRVTNDKFSTDGDRKGCVYSRAIYEIE